MYVNKVCNLIEKLDEKNANGTPNKWHQISVMAQKWLNGIAFLFPHQLTCTYNGEVTKVQEDTICNLSYQKKLKDEYKGPDVLPKVNKANMTGTIKDIKEYLISHCNVKRAPLIYIIKKTITVQTYGIYPWFATPPTNDCQDAVPTDRTKLTLHSING